MSKGKTDCLNRVHAKTFLAEQAIASPFDTIEEDSYPDEEERLAFIIRQYEKDALDLIRSRGYPDSYAKIVNMVEDHSEYQWRIRHITMPDGRTVEHKKDYKVCTLAADVLFAREVVLQCDRIKEYISEGYTTKAILAMMRIVTSAMGAHTRGTLIQGIYRRAGQIKGSHAKKRLKGVFLAVETAIAETGDTSFKGVWHWLKKYTSDSPYQAGGFEVYVDGEGIIQIEDSTGNEKSITSESLKRYVIEVRKKSKAK